MNFTRGACELCNCIEFRHYTPNVKYKCSCTHGDVWHKRIPLQDKSHVIIDIKPPPDIKNKLKNIIKPLIQLFNKNSNNNMSRECPICFEEINTLMVLNCGHPFCEECCENIITICPLCREYITNKIKVY